MASAVRTMTRAKRAKPSKQRIPEDVKLARLILPAGQARAGAFEAVDISNHSDDDQRTMVRSGERRTIRRKHKTDELVTRGVISREQARYCEWYINQFEQHYHTKVRVADWQASAGSTDKAYGHWPKGQPLGRGLTMLEYARDGIGKSLIGLFESVLFDGAQLGRRSLAFRIAVEQLIERIEGRVNL